MDPELKKALDDLRGALSENEKRNTDVVARLDTIDEKATERETKITESEEMVKALRTELDELKKGTDERDQKITDMQQKMRVAREQSDPLANDQRAAVEMIGMMGRELLANYVRSEIPERYRGEADLLKAYAQARADRLSPQQRATLEESTGVGAYFIPTLLDSAIIDAMEEESDMLARVDLQTGMPTKYTIPVLTTTPTLQPKRASSDTDMTQSDPVFGQLSVDSEECYFYFPVDNWLLELSPHALGSFLMSNLVSWFNRGLANWVVMADGSASYNSFTGLLNEATYVVNMDAGKTSFADIDNTQLMKALAYLYKRGRARGVFGMSLYVLGLLEELNRTGKPKVITEGKNGEYRCKNRPVVIEEDMPDEGDNDAGVGFMTIGDLGTELVSVAGSGIRPRVSTEVLWKRNQTCFGVIAHVAIARKPVKTLALLKTAAA